LDLDMKNQTLLDTQAAERADDRKNFEAAMLKHAVNEVTFTPTELAFHATQGWDTLKIIEVNMELVMEDLNQVRMITGRLQEVLALCDDRNGRESSEAGKRVQSLKWQLFGVASHLRGTAKNLHKAIGLCLHWESATLIHAAVCLSATAYEAAHTANEDSRY